jgi:hypothetical protein
MPLRNWNSLNVAFEGASFYFVGSLELLLRVLAANGPKARDHRGPFCEMSPIVENHKI